MDLSVATSGSHSGALASARSGEARRHSAQFVRDRRLHCRTSWGSLMKPFLIVAVCAATGFGWTPRCASQGQPRSLFNGKDLTGWHVDVPAADSNPRLRRPFLVRNGVLVSLDEPHRHLIMGPTYRDCSRDVEYRSPSKPGNLDVIVHAPTPRSSYATVLVT